jgi:hypothetical protein
LRLLLEHSSKQTIEVFRINFGRKWYYRSHPVSLESVPHDVKVRYAYYASDNQKPGTLASGGLGTTGVKPTYLITIKILEQIFNVK